MARENSICKWIGPLKNMGKQEWCSWWTIYFEEFLKNRKQIRSNLWEKSEHREFHFWLRIYFSHQTSLVLFAKGSGHPNITKTQSMCLQLHFTRILRDLIQPNILIRKNTQKGVKLAVMTFRDRKGHSREDSWEEWLEKYSHFMFIAPVICFSMKEHLWIQIIVMETILYGKQGE